MRQFSELFNCKNCNKLISKYKIYDNKDGYSRMSKELSLYCSIECQKQSGYITYLNEDFFDFNKPEYCYLAGWLFSDGYIAKNRISLMIGDNDANNIKENIFLCGNWSIYYIDRKNPNHKDIIYYDIASVKTANKFRLLNFHKKSQFMSKKFLELIPNKYFHLFLRGLFDGDGCWFYKSIKSHREFIVCSSFDFNWNWMIKKLKFLGINSWKCKKQIKSTGRTQTLRLYKSSEIKLLGDYIYSDNLHLKLDRKYYKFLQMFINNEKFPLSIIHRKNYNKYSKNSPLLLE